MTTEEKPKKVKKPFYKRWWVWGIVVLFFIILGSGEDEPEPVASSDDTAEAAENNNDDGSENNSNEDSSENGNEESGNESENNSNNDSNTNNEDEAAEEHVGGIGDTVELGDVTFTANSIEFGVEELGNDFSSETTNEQFVLVDITFVNDGNESVSLDTSFFKLLAGETVYDSNRSASRHASGGEGVFSDVRVNPGITLDGVVAFEAPSDETEFVLQVKTGWWSRETTEIKLY